MASLLAPEITGSAQAPNVELVVHPIIAVSAANLEILMQRAAALEEAHLKEEGWISEEDVSASRNLTQYAWIADILYDDRPKPFQRVGEKEEDPPRRMSLVETENPGPAPSQTRSPSKERRYHKRLAQKILHGHTVRPKVRAKLIQPTLAIPAMSKPITEDIRATMGGYQGKVQNKALVWGPRTLKDLADQQYEYIPWDGKTPRPLIDPQGNVFGVLAGRPNDDEWLKACERLYDAMCLEASQVEFTKKQYTHRGDFPAINVGISPGQGSKFPHNLGLGTYEAMMTRLLENPGLQYIADYHSCEYRLIDLRPLLIEHRVFEAMVSATLPSAEVRARSSSQSSEIWIRAQTPDSGRRFPHSCVQFRSGCLD
ncbi:hypothetical protein NP233_g12907 [Leucocoprinus birnbaumii]|uniref:Uncharacterized protein n=1 Tax=Leucocoprinus birnbaumii TaxID=56174 RepID=A0AAD5VDS5_9AGAR|nr:hypothetical protein NP233_g12907 [Leucocoprinus birnbaumii]